MFFYIKKNRETICFPDTNIHYVFNSYNGTGIWKTFDLQMYEYCFFNDENSRKKTCDCYVIEVNLAKYIEQIIGKEKMLKLLKYS